MHACMCVHIHKYVYKPVYTGKGWKGVSGIPLFCALFSWEYLSLYLELGWQLGVPARLSDVCVQPHPCGCRIELMFLQLDIQNVLLPTESSSQPQIVLCFYRTNRKFYYEIWNLLFEISGATYWTGSCECFHIWDMSFIWDMNLIINRYL